MTGPVGERNAAPKPKRAMMAVEVSWLCRWFGHRVKPLLTDDYWIAVQHRCVRCGWRWRPGDES